MSIRAGILRFLLRRTIKKQFAALDDPAALRDRVKAAGRLTPKIPDDVSTEPVTANGVPCEWIRTDAADGDRALIYFHGGGYVLPGLEGHRDLAWRLADSARLAVLMVDYRLAPEHPFPAAVEDATDVWRWVMNEGYVPEKVAIGGDSAGGGLTVAALVNFKNLGLPLPNGALLLSPWTDLTASGDSVTQNAEADCMIDPAALDRFAALYMGDLDRRAPLASPLFADLSGLPATYIQAGSTEVLLSDAERLIDKLKASGVEALLDVWPKMPHVFPVFASRLPEGRQAIEKLGEFLRRRTGVTE